jgi:hypothetical protein
VVICHFWFSVDLQEPKAHHVKVYSQTECKLANCCPLKTRTSMFWQWCFVLSNSPHSYLQSMTCISLLLYHTSFWFHSSRCGSSLLWGQIMTECNDNPEWMIATDIKWETCLWLTGSWNPSEHGFKLGKKFVLVM